MTPGCVLSLRRLLKEEESSCLLAMSSVAGFALVMAEAKSSIAVAVYRTTVLQRPSIDPPVLGVQAVHRDCLPSGVWTPSHVLANNE